MKIEKKLDAEFERMGVKPYIYHIMEIPAMRFRAITFAVPERIGSVALENIVFAGITVSPAMNQANFMRWWLGEHGIYGVAICDQRDNFNRALGRVIAKGRLLKQLKEGEGA